MISCKTFCKFNKNKGKQLKVSDSKELTEWDTKTLRHDENKKEKLYKLLFPGWP